MKTIMKKGLFSVLVILATLSLGRVVLAEGSKEVELEVRGMT